MEFGLDDALKLYAGGLGILAGDHLKGAHDIGLPLVGIGILWRQGYVRQTIDADGQPADTYRHYHYDPSVVEDTGVEVTVPVQGDDVRVKVWKTTAFGNAPLYLLDTDLPGNPHQPTTWQLYGGAPEVRVAQEIVLGIGGVRALRALGHRRRRVPLQRGPRAPRGRRARAREDGRRGQSEAAALAATREEVVFTTHTPIPAGNETHPVDRLVYVGADLGLGRRVARGARRQPVQHDRRRAAREPRGQRRRAAARRDGARHVGRRRRRAPHRRHHQRHPRPDVGRPGRPGRGRVAGLDDDLWAAHQANKRALIAHVEAATGTRLRRGPPARRLRAPRGRLQAAGPHLRGRRRHRARSCARAACSSSSRARATRSTPRARPSSPGSSRRRRTSATASPSSRTTRCGPARR